MGWNSLKKLLILSDFIDAVILYERCFTTLFAMGWYAFSLSCTWNDK